MREKIACYCGWEKLQTKSGLITGLKYNIIGKDMYLDEEILDDAGNYRHDKFTCTGCSKVYIWKLWGIPPGPPK